MEEMKKEQEKSKKKGARGKKLKGAGSVGANSERSKEHRPPKTEAHKCNTGFFWKGTEHESMKVPVDAFKEIRVRKDLGHLLTSYIRIMH